MRSTWSGNDAELAYCNAGHALASSRGMHAWKRKTTIIMQTSARAGKQTIGRNVKWLRLKRLFLGPPHSVRPLQSPHGNHCCCLVCRCRSFLLLLNHGFKLNQIVSLAPTTPLSGLPNSKSKTDEYRKARVTVQPFLDMPPIWYKPMSSPWQTR